MPPIMGRGFCSPLLAFIIPIIAKAPIAIVHAHVNKEVKAHNLHEIANIIVLKIDNTIWPATDIINSTNP